MARRFCEQRFPHALVTVLCGSWAYGRAHDDSDLDIVVLDAEMPDVLFEGSLFESWVIDLCAMAPNRVETLFRASQRHSSRTAPIAREILDGIVLSGEADRLTGMQELAREILAEGPPPLSDAEKLDLRFALTALLRDLAHVSSEELPTVAAQCHSSLALAALDLQRAWRGERKNLRRRLVEAVPGLAERLDAGLVAACQGERGLLLELGQELLVRLGGPQYIFVDRYFSNTPD